jgi:glycine/D-amino acid oxidase-like deaminating enzyme
MMPDVVVVGAGLWGLSVAWHLAARHGARVRVVDRRDAAGLETSAQSAGQIGQVRQHGLAVEAAGYALEFASSLAHRRDPEAFVRSGSVTLVERKAAAAAWRSRITSASAAGVAIQRLASEDARRLVPGLYGEFAAAYHVPGDGYVSPRRYLRALTADVAALGVVCEYGVEVQGFDLDGASVVALRTSRGSLTGGTYMVAAGPWTPMLLGRGLPVLPIAHGLARTVADAVPAARPVVRFPEHGLYVRSEQDGHLFGRFVRQPQVADTSGRGFTPLEPDYRELASARDLVARWLPRLASLPVDHFRQGWTTCSPDGLPLAGQHPTLRNAWMATACGAMGVVWAAALGSWLAESIVAERAVPSLTPLAPGRFGARSSDHAWVRRSCLRQHVDYYGLAGLARSLAPGPAQEYSTWT